MKNKNIVVLLSLATLVSCNSQSDEKNNDSYNNSNTNLNNNVS